MYVWWLQIEHTLNSSYQIIIFCLYIASSSNNVDDVSTCCSGWWGYFQTTYNHAPGMCRKLHGTGMNRLFLFLMPLIMSRPMEKLEQSEQDRLFYFYPQARQLLSEKPIGAMKPVHSA